jgi:hypothetical protein
MLGFLGLSESPAAASRAESFLSMDPREFSISISCCEPSPFIRLTHPCHRLEINVFDGTHVLQYTRQCLALSQLPPGGAPSTGTTRNPQKRFGKFASVVGSTLSCKPTRLRARNALIILYLSLSRVHVPRRMADVAYDTSSFPALLRTHASLLALSNNNAQSHRDYDDSDVQVADDAAGVASSVQGTRSCRTAALGYDDARDGYRA